VLTARSLNGVRVALVPLQLTLSAARRPCLISLSRKLFLLIVLQSIGKLKFTVTVVLTGTSTASSVGEVETTIDFGLPEAAAVPTIPRITNNAASGILLTIFLIIVVIFLLENMTLISLVTCI
jgi:hypothetical protein